MDTQAELGGPSRPASVTNEDDRLWAALAHGSAFFVFFGPIVPVVMWFTQRKKSAYIAFQALEAMIYQSLFFWTWVLLIPLLMIVLVVAWMFAMILLNPDERNAAFLIGFVPQLFIWGVMLGTFVIYGGIGIWGAITSLLGRDFRYPFFGSRMAQYLEYHGPDTAALPEDREDGVVAAVSHSTCALVLWGLITPIIVWITQHEGSKFLRFQALQAVIYQAIGLIAYMGFMVLYFVSIFGLIGVGALASTLRTSGSLAWLGVFLLPFVAIICVFAIGGPIYQVLAFIAALRTLRGHNFHYPILGNILESRLDQAGAK